MTMLAETVDAVIGVDTHRDSLALAVVDAATGRVMAETEVAADGQGYLAARSWAALLAPGRRAWAVEGTGSYGAGLASSLADDGEQVFEIDRVTRKRKTGKTDAVDAVRAAREALARDQLPPVPRQRGRREAIRVTLTSREGAITARSAAHNQLAALVVTAAEPIRALLRGRTGKKLLQAVADLPTPHFAAGELATLEARVCIRALQQTNTRIAFLTEEIDDYDRTLDELLAGHPLLLEPGIGPISAARILISWSHAGRFGSDAAFARHAGVAPLPASSGRTIRHRLSRLGDRQLNRALHTIADNRMAYDPATRDYVARRLAEGKSIPEIRRCLKRAIARQLYRLLNHHDQPQADARHAA